MYWRSILWLFSHYVIITIFPFLKLWIGGGISVLIAVLFTWTTAWLNEKFIGKRYRDQDSNYFRYVLRPLLVFLAVFAVILFNYWIIIPGFGNVWLWLIFNLIASVYIYSKIILGSYGIQ